MIVTIVFKRMVSGVKHRFRIISHIAFFDVLRLIRLFISPEVFRQYHLIDMIFPSSIALRRMNKTSGLLT